MFVKPTDTHQFLYPTSSHPYHCKKRIPYSQALRLNTICSDNTNFDKCCNYLQKWLMERGYNENMILKQTLRAHELCRDDILEREKQKMSEQKLIFKITYYLAFQNVRAIMWKLHILVTPNKNNKKVFPNVTLIVFRNGKSFKYFLVTATLPKLTGSGRCEPCG